MRESPTLGEVLDTTRHQSQLWASLGINIYRPEESFAQVCRRHGLDKVTMMRLVDALRTTPPTRQVVVLELMTLSELCDYTMQRGCLQSEVARLDEMTRTAAEQQGAEHPSFAKIREAFVAFRDRLAEHLREEKEQLFPHLRRLANDRRGRGLTPGRLRARLERLEGEHNRAEEALDELSAWVEDRTFRQSVPRAARAFAKAIAGLREAFHEQVYIEDQVLWPRALARRGAG